jgi:hypothetical protein
MKDMSYTHQVKGYSGKVPVFVANAVSDNSDQVEFFCLYCVKYHRHGADGGNFEGHRSAHCAFETPLTKTGYILISEKRSRSKILQKQQALQTI